MKRALLIIVLLGLALSSCGVYVPYQSPVASDQAATGGELPSWREFFADPCLKELIDSAISRNTTLAVAALRLQQADESLSASKLAYLPAVFFQPNGGISVKPDQRSSSYSLPLSVEWNFGAPGALFTRRHQAQARRIKAQDEYDALLNEIIAQTAADYYMLQMLDDQVEILENTVSVWTRTLDVQKEYMRSGRAYYSAVAQMESKLIDARQQLLQTRADIEVWERAVCLLVAKPFGSVRRTRSGEYAEPPFLENGIPLCDLRSRPDLRAAERDLEIAYYITSEAKSALYPSIRLNGLAGWPSALDAALSLVQPLFAQGALRSRINISKMEQEIAVLQFNQSVLQAATEVSQAMADYRLNVEKARLFSSQVEIQEKACAVVEEIFRDGNANYLELIKAQEKLLSAQLGKIECDYKTRESAVMLFKGL